MFTQYKHLADELIKSYPEGMFFRFLSGKNGQFSGNLTEAIRLVILKFFLWTIFDYSYFQPTCDDWSTFKHGCQWELYWTYGLQGDWKMAIANIKLLSEECFWSPAVIDYLYAIALVSLNENL